MDRETVSRWICNFKVYQEHGVRFYGHSIGLDLNVHWPGIEHGEVVGGLARSLDTSPGLLMTGSCTSNRENEDTRSPLEASDSCRTTQASSLHGNHGDFI